MHDEIQIEDTPECREYEDRDVERIDYEALRQLHCNGLRYPA